MKREIKDIAGVRVICPFISDVYQVANMLVNQADVEIVTIKDYIKKTEGEWLQESSYDSAG